MTLIAALAVFTAITLAPEAATRGSASTGTLRVDPPTQSVPPGAVFNIDLTQGADVATSGAQATIGFDPALLQVQSLSVGPVYESGTVLAGKAAGVTGGTTPTIDEAIADANASGELQNVATFLASSSAPAGDNTFITLTMQAVAPGTSPIRLVNALMIDEIGDEVPVTATDGSVVIDASAAAPPTPVPQTPAQAGVPSSVTGEQTSPAGSGSSPAGTMTPVSSVKGESRVPSLTTATFSIAPASQKTSKEGTFTFDVKQLVDGAASAAEAKIAFRKDLVEVVKLEPGAGWKVTASALDAAMEDANNSGELNVTLTADKTNGPPTSGESTIVTVTMQGRAGKQGKSVLKLATTDIIGLDGNPVPVTAKDGEVIVGSAGGGGLSATWLVAGVVVVLVVGGGGAFAVRRRMGAA